ncbi:hypothetical protein GOV03_02870 [Candidatus Woesearchaeota archaeon]|nr:hypothetical protein [Candidatus Woesearchaeota archaeon]
MDKNKDTLEKKCINGRGAFRIKLKDGHCYCAAHNSDCQFVDLVDVFLDIGNEDREKIYLGCKLDREYDF